MRFLDTRTDPPEQIRAALTQASILDQAEVEARAREIVAEVRRGGDAAVRDCHRRFDGAELGELEVPRGAWESARAELEPEAIAAMDAARAAIEAFHQQQPRQSWTLERDGARLTQRLLPLARV